jgi:hypothetical protein
MLQRSLDQIQQDDEAKWLLDEKTNTSVAMGIGPPSLDPQNTGLQDCLHPSSSHCDFYGSNGNHLRDLAITRKKSARSCFISRIGLRETAHPTPL